MADQLARWYESHLFLEDAVPYYALSFGSDDFAAYVGCALHLAADGTTSWSTKVLDDLKTAKITFDPNGKWWQKTVDFYHVVRRTLGDSMMIAAPTLSAGLDALSALYGATETLTAMIDEPEMVQDALSQINQAFSDAMNNIRKVFEFDKYGSINRHGMYAQGSIGVPQCDFSCMISSDMFEEFACPSLLHEMDELTQVEYHLDGPGAVRHLEALCNIKKLHTIQWVAGAGEAEKQDWLWLYQKILNLGKNIYASTSPREILRMQSALKSSKAYYNVQVKSMEEMNQFLDAFHKIPEC